MAIKALKATDQILVQLLSVRNHRALFVVDAQDDAVPFDLQFNSLVPELRDVVYGQDRSRGKSLKVNRNRVNHISGE